MPSKAVAPGRNITDFFKPYTIPKDRVPRRDIIEEEIIVASPSKAKQQSDPVVRNRRQNASPLSKQRSVSTSPLKRGPGRPRKDGSATPTQPRLDTRPPRHVSLRESTPSRRSPRNHINDMDRAYDMLPPSSSLMPFSSSQSTPTKVRQMEAVHIPFPRRLSPVAKPESDKKPLNTSSFSSLTSVPLSSQSSSRRITTKSGVAAVTNSDSASVSSSSDDELMDIDVLVPRKRQKITPPGDNISNATAGRSTATGTRTSLRQSHGRAVASGAWKPPSPPPTTSYKYSLAKLVKQHNREAANEAKIADAEARVHEAERLRKEEEDNVLRESDGMAMAAAYAENSDEGERMKQAFERTEALRGKETFCFFRGDTDVSVAVELLDQELEAYSLGFMKDDSKRSYACTSGFLAAIAFHKGLPDGVIKWLQHSLLREPSRELCDSYVAALEALIEGGHGLSEPVFSLSKGYTSHTFRDAEDLRPRNNKSYKLPGNLTHALKAMAVLASVVETIDRASALAELILLNNDDQIRQSPSLQIDLEQAINAILESNDISGLPSLYQETTRQILTASALSRPLLARALARLPVTTLALHKLRRHLTLHFLLESPPTEPLDPCDPETGARLLQKLHSQPCFAVSESTNYNYLLSLTNLLDIAIDAGFSDFAFLPKPTQTSSTGPGSVAAPPKLSSFFSASANSANRISPEETAFNSQIDAFCLRLRTMLGKIRDAGTSHLKRTEAKSALERLVVKLEVVVRTRTKPRKGVFDRGTGDREMMRGFLAEAGKAERKVGEGDTKPRVRFLEAGERCEGDGSKGFESGEGGSGAVKEEGRESASAAGADREDNEAGASKPSQ